MSPRRAQAVSAAAEPVAAQGVRPGGGAGRPAPAAGVCDWCGKLRQLDHAGMLVRHRISIPVSRAAVPTVGRGRVRPSCSGSGKPPRRRER